MSITVNSNDWNGGLLWLKIQQSEVSKTWTKLKYDCPVVHRSCEVQQLVCFDSFLLRKSQIWRLDKRDIGHGCQVSDSVLVFWGLGFWCQTSRAFQLLISFESSHSAVMLHRGGNKSRQEIFDNIYLGGRAATLQSEECSGTFVNQMDQACWREKATISSTLQVLLLRHYSLGYGM